MKKLVEKLENLKFEINYVTRACFFTSVKASLTRLQVSSNINTIPFSSATSTFENEEVRLKFYTV